MIAQFLSMWCKENDVEYFFKASFDKANRTSASSHRGHGMQDTLEDFLRMKNEIDGLKTTTDFHNENQIVDMCVDYDEAIDMLQIPAFLCRQTDLLMEAATCGKAVNVKKGQFVSYEQVGHIVGKLQSAPEITITDRGFQHGYNSYVVDFLGLQHMVAEPGYNVCLDISHSLQKPNSGSTTGGVHLEYGYGLAAAAFAVGVKTIFAETMVNPEEALSDKETTYPLAHLIWNLERCLPS